MKKTKNNPFIVDEFKIEGFCRENSYYVRFTDDDLHLLYRYVRDMGYKLQPVKLSKDPKHPFRFKIINRTNDKLYGWISKVKELENGIWKTSFLYGFYESQHKFYNKYSITDYIYDTVERTKAKLYADKTKWGESCFRASFGIMDLEKINPLDFVMSFMATLKIKTT